MFDRRKFGILKAMSEQPDVLYEIKLYMDAAHEALAAAKMNLESDFYSTAASRTYYAVFYGASALLKTKGLSYSKHTAVLSAFRQHFIKTGIFRVNFSEMYKILFDARQAGDYEMLTKFEPDILRKNLDNAQEFIAEVETWLQRHNFLST
ncbi:MAG: HEPN domain-containing protein [Chloroflexota bacterium]